MNTFLSSFELFSSAALAFVVVGSLIGYGAVVAMRDRLSTWAPASRHRALVVIGVLPALAAALLFLSALLPSFAALVLSRFDHCNLHDDGHAHLCFVHPPHVTVYAWLVVGLAFIAGFALALAAFHLAAARRVLKLLRSLVGTGEYRSEWNVTLIDVKEPFCAVFGLLRPRIILSRLLFEALGPAQRAVVFAHERAHASRHDALASFLVNLLSPLHLPHVRRWLLQELSIAAEQACDEEAAREVGDRVAVASTILTVARAVGSGVPSSSVVVAFGQCAIERRVESLLGEPVVSRPGRHDVALLLAFAAFALLCTGELHHLTESALSAVLH